MSTNLLLIKWGDIDIWEFYSVLSLVAVTALFSLTERMGCSPLQSHRTAAGPCPVGKVWIVYGGKTLLFCDITQMLAELDRTVMRFALEYN